MIRPRLALLGLVGLCAAAPAGAERFDFVAFGDMPYCRQGDAEGCAREEARVSALVREINAARPAFTVFLGDTKADAEHCTDEAVLQRTRRWTGLLEGALVYTPGDNEWTDCWQDRMGRYDPLERLALIRREFFSTAMSLGRAPMPLQRQSDLDPVHRDYVENSRWARDGVLFATVHVTGSDNNRPPEAARPQPPGAAEEFPARDAANRAWIRDAFALAGQEGHRAVVLFLQADMFYRDRCGRGDIEGFRGTLAALAEGAAAYGRPVLLVHGDSHFLLMDHPLRDASGKVLGNITRVMVPGVQDVRAVRVAVDSEAAQPFAVSTLGPADRVAAPRCD